MSWQNEMVIIVRHLIDDLDPNNYQFSDDRIEEAIVVAAQLIHNETEFNTAYTVEVDNRVLSPDPTLTPVGSDSKDDDFIALCCLRAAILFTASQIKTYSMKSIILRDGPSLLDMRGVVAGLKALHDDLTKKYDEVKLDYQTSKLGLGKAILSPYSPGSHPLNPSFYSVDGRSYGF